MPENKKNTKIKNKKRMIAVLAVLAVAIIVAYILFRGSYLEMKEIGENYVSVYWKNISYTAIVLAINFAFIYTSIYTTNRKIKIGLKEFFDQEKRKCQNY